MNERPEQAQGVVVLKYYHVIILLFVQLLGIGAAYGKLTSDVQNMKEDVSRRLGKIEGNFVSYGEFDNWRKEFQQNLRDLQNIMIRRNLGIQEK